MFVAKLILQLLEFLRGDQRAIVSVKHVMRHLPRPHISRMLVYRIVANAIRPDVTRLLVRAAATPEKIVLSVVHCRDRLAFPLHDDPFGAQFLRDREYVE